MPRASATVAPPSATSQPLDAHTVAREALEKDVARAKKKLEKLKDLIENNTAWLDKYRGQFDTTTKEAEAKMRLLKTL